MKLGEIREYMKAREQSTLSDVATHFDISKEAAGFALDYWVKKGKIQAQRISCGTGGCNGCGVADESYQWVVNEKVIHWV